MSEFDDRKEAGERRQPPPLDAHTTPLPSSGKRVGDSGNARGHSWGISNKRSLRDA